LIFNLFELIRERVSALDVAERAGLALSRRGARSWACCPLHGEKTPSMCFYEDGGWHCFGCGEGGDATALYAATHRLPMGEAAQRLAAEWGITDARADAETGAPAALTAGDMRRTVMEWFDRVLSAICDLRDAASSLLRTYTKEEADEDEETFTLALETWSWADIELNALDNMDEEEIIELYMERGK
jgi:DNA primase